MSKELLKTLLNYDFYNKYKDNIKDTLFPEKHIRSLYKTLEQAYTVTHTNISVRELEALHLIYNPALTQAAKINLHAIFEELETVNISNSVGEETLRQAIRNNLFTEAAAMCMDAADNREINIVKLQEILTQANMGIKSEEFGEVSSDLDYLLTEDAGHFKWKYHHSGLRDVLDGIGPGIFTLVAARPNAGKTAFIVSNIFHPEGWIGQGAHVHLVANEESATRTILRGYSAWTGLTKAEIRANTKDAAEKFAKAKPYLHVVNEEKLGIMSISRLEQYIQSKKDLDILILDQIDKMIIEGNFASEVDRLRKLYTYVRNMTVKYAIPIIGVCQASEAADGKLYYGFECLENSKTGKAAEVDVCITLGMKSFSATQGQDDGFRVANIVKNKPTGKETYVGYMLEHQLSRISV